MGDFLAAAFDKFFGMHRFLVRYGTNIVKIGDSLESKPAYCDVEISSGTQYDCFETEALCQAFLEENN